jgi:hypothetical protein
MCYNIILRPNMTPEYQLKVLTIFKPPSAIVYSKDFEPISHIPMNDAMYEYFMNNDEVRFPVFKSVKPKPEDLLNVDGFPVARITALRVYSPDGTRLILISKDDETTLLMRNIFLPGQTKEITYLKDQAFLRGMIKAMKDAK